MTISIEQAREIMVERLHKNELAMNAMGSVLPGYDSRPKSHLIITQEKEYDCGWVFYYNTREFIVDGTSSSRLAGNWPYIVSREDGSIHETGNRPLQEYLNQ